MNKYNYYLIQDGDRYFLAPLLLGGLGGAAIVGLSRPRPVFVNPAQPMPMPYPPVPPYASSPLIPPYGPYMGTSSGFNYSGYNYYN